MRETKRKEKEENEQIDRKGKINSMTDNHNRINRRTLEQKVNIYPISTTIEKNTSSYRLSIATTIDESHLRPSTHWSSTRFIARINFDRKDVRSNKHDYHHFQTHKGRPISSVIL